MFFFNCKEIKSEKEELQTGSFIKMLDAKVVRLTETAMHAAVWWDSLKRTAFCEVAVGASAQARCQSR